MTANQICKIASYYFRENLCWTVLWVIKVQFFKWSSVVRIPAFLNPPNVMFNLKKGNVTFLFPNKMISTNKWCVAKSKK